MIRARDLGVVYPGGTVALTGVDLDIAAGDFSVLVGRSGGGKSTLLRALNGSIKPTTGSVVVDGIDLGRVKGSELRTLRSGIAFIPQQFNLIKRSSVLSNALAGALGRVGVLPGLLGMFPSEDRQLALANIERMGLQAKRHRRVDTLSGGEQQRVAICRSFTQQPSVILADEPVSNLDHHLAEQIMETLREINRRDGITLVVALHDLRLALGYADSIVVLNDGSVVFSGTSHGVSYDDLKELAHMPVAT